MGSCSGKPGGCEQEANIANSEDELANFIKNNIEGTRGALSKELNSEYEKFRARVQALTLEKGGGGNKYKKRKKDKTKKKKIKTKKIKTKKIKTKKRHYKKNKYKRI